MRAPEIELSLDDLRAVTSFATACATWVLPVFEAARGGDDRPRRAVDEATTTDASRLVHRLDGRLRT
ncbi:hypothetical protein [Nocardioides sp. CFH 31398]|uniref:hypothetical protein n=1 Tax=Nocardioides sp. CFH 31398 TaxID=2919579 RepID=UPI001F0648CF|nr:hypothetical protein [Nocardioides sp. CFH 31398]MCH1865071.1 hypothetical protein [Nocardioides sp. CFH 31398]